MDDATKSGQVEDKRGHFQLRMTMWDGTPIRAMPVTPDAVKPSYGDVRCELVWAEGPPAANPKVDPWVISTKDYDAVTDQATGMVTLVEKPKG